MTATAILTDDMIAVIHRAILCFAATVNEDGTPNLSPKASLTTRKGALFFADIASPRTIDNLHRNSAIAINVVDVFARRGYRFSGVGEVLSPGHEDYDPVAKWVWSVNGSTYPVHHVVRVRVTEASPIRSPAYTFDKEATEETLRGAFLTRYGMQAAS